MPFKGLSRKKRMGDETILQCRVPPKQAGKQLLDYLASRFRYQTPEVWRNLIGLGKVTVNGKTALPTQALEPGDKLSYAVILKEPPVDKNIRILHEEETFLVAMKPGQLPSHADGNFIKNTFIYLITEHLRKGGWKGDVKLVHRLDRETSGLLVVAKDREAHRKLAEQFEKGLVEKEYRAVSRGAIEQWTFEVNGAIGKDRESQISVRQKLVPPGTPFSKPSVTFFEKLEDLREATVLRCIPKTGRTNQIRVHLDSIGHPLVGDKLYGRSDDEFLAFVRHVKSGGDPAWAGHLETPRHLLHASKLSFAHPETGEKIFFEAEMPEDMRRYLEKNKLK
jgi:RluA family pseudouridine synthase